MEVARKSNPPSPLPNNAEFRVPPQDLEAEQSVLGAMMLSSEAIRLVIPLCKAEDFYREANRKLYQAIVALDDRKEPVDIITLSNELKRMGEFDTIGGVSALTALIERVPTAANAEYYANIVKEKSAARRLITAATQVVGDAYADTMPIKELLDSAEHRIFEATELRETKDFNSIRDLIGNSFEYVNNLSDQKMHITGVPTGFFDLDDLTAGLQPAEMIVVGARPSMGKTSLALNIAQHVCMGTNQLKKKIPVGFFSIEMTAKQLALRLLCSVARIDLQKARSGYLNDHDRSRLVNITGQFYEAKLFIDDTSSMTVLDLKAKARRLKREHGIGLLIIDYLQLIQAGIRTDTREQEIAYISRQLKALAKDLDIPVMVLSQLSRPQKGAEEKRPVLSDLRESGAIEQDADVVVFIHKETADTADDGSPRFSYELVVAKQRNGPTDNVPVVFRREYTTFESASKVSEK
ncbi:MAG TPA: replicative DNA helicase [bacterium]|nr:replicative DNA helicase [bacterium]